ncbi:MAG: response regulator [Candidatus Sumerlaeota bacterium]|nr:response regulator [Candidatus Sumerlaeota bacterium]
MARRLDMLTARAIPPADMLSLDGARLLVVDDNASSRETIRDILEILRFQVDVASHGIAALEMIRARPYQAVLTDLMMPRMSGLELLIAIKQTNPLLPVIVVTAFGSISNAIEAMRQGAADFLTKPFEAALMEHIVKKVLREQRLVQRNQQLQAELNQKAVIEALNRQLVGKVEELTKLNAINNLMNSSLGNQSLLQEIVAVAADITSAEKVSLLLVDHDRGELIVRAAIGLPREAMKRTRQKIGEGIAGKVAQDKRALRADRFGAVEEGGPETDGRAYRSKPFLSAPIMVGDEVFGVLNLADKHNGAEFTRKDEELIGNLAQKAAIKLENNALYEGLYSNLVDTMCALVTTLEARDPYTHSHSRRVTDYSVAIARGMDLSDEDIAAFKFAGILHDIGKIGIQDHILHKPGRLDGGEYSIIKKHPTIGDAIVKPLGLVPIEHSLIRSHHERFDGRGYPVGLAG